jgi:hypothetical protein
MQMRGKAVQEQMFTAYCNVLVVPISCITLLPNHSQMLSPMLVDQVPLVAAPPIWQVRPLLPAQAAANNIQTLVRDATHPHA